MKRDDVLAKLSAHRAELNEMGIESLSIFGSVAREQSSDSSDVDLLVELNRRMGLFQFVRIQQRIEAILGGVTVDLVLADALREEFQPHVYEDLVRAV